MFDLSGQTAIVTGAATGIGEVIALRLANAGATVAVADLNLNGAAKVADATGHSSFPVLCDVTNTASVADAVREVLSRTGRIDILVNNAGIAGRQPHCGNKPKKTGSGSSPSMCMDPQTCAARLCHTW